MKYQHEVVRDLMPLCIDGIASPQSEQLVRAHIAECPECAAEWAQMQPSSIPQSPAERPAEVLRYAETAKRVRRHNRLMRLLTAGIMLVLFGGLYARGLYTSGAHLTMRGVMDDLVQKDIADHVFSEEYGQTPDPHNLPHLEYEYLGEVKNPKGYAASAYAFVRHPYKELYSFTECYGSRKDAYHFNLLYECAGGGWSFQPMKTGIYMQDGGFSQTSSTEKKSAEIRCAAFYVTDPRVRTLTVTDGNTERTLTPDENGFCSMLRQSDDEITCGTAYGENGNVLYTVQQVEHTNENGELYGEPEWVQAEG